jgi:hypothetical protein
MPRILPPAAPSSQDKSLDRAAPPRPAAGFAGQPRSIAMTMIVKDALLRHYGSFKAAAAAMGAMDQGQLTRDLDSGKFKFERLELCDLPAKAAVSKALAEAFGNTDPRAERRRLIRQIRRDLDALDELAEIVA